jgi:SOS response regulatory protein OraA/RecX
MEEQTVVQTLEGKLQELGAQKDEILEKMMEIHAQLDEELAKGSLKRKLDALTPAERKLLGIPDSQVVATNGISTEEAVNGN